MHNSDLWYKDKKYEPRRGGANSESVWHMVCYAPDILTWFCIYLHRIMYMKKLWKITYNKQNTEKLTLKANETELELLICYLGSDAYCYNGVQEVFLIFKKKKYDAVI